MIKLRTSVRQKAGHRPLWNPYGEWLNSAGIARVSQLARRILRNQDDEVEAGEMIDNGLGSANSFTKWPGAEATGEQLCSGIDLPINRAVNISEGEDHRARK